jgi:hypothetical protein
MGYMLKRPHRFYHHRPVKVILECTKEWIDESAVEFLNIEEDMEGKDLLTFKCPVCKQEHKSHRIG